MDCIFCRIIKGEVPSAKVYEDELVYAFDDIEPQAPVHTLIVPKLHVATLNELDDGAVWQAMLAAARRVARTKGIQESGYRTVINCGEEGGQIVRHLHLHVLGGRKLDGRMG